MKIKNIKEISVGYNGLEISGTFIDKDNEEIFLKDYGIINEDATEYVLDLQKRIDKAIELLEDDYFEDGSGNNIDKVLSILRGEE